MMLNNLTYESILSFEKERGSKSDQRQSKDTIDQTKEKIKASFSSAVKVQASLSQKAAAHIKPKRQQQN